jgi:hypothetical protein
MTDNELETLRDRVLDVERRLNEHENMRSTAINALGIVQTHVERLQRRMTATVPPAVEAARQTTWLEQIAIVKTRVHAVEEWTTDMAKIVVEDHEMLREIVDLLKRGQR